MKTESMQSSQNLSADWTQVLARVEKALLQAIGAIQDREQAMASAAPLADPPRPLQFAKLEQRMAVLAGCHVQAEKQFAQLDLALGESEESMRHWLTSAEAARKRLAAWVGRAVG